MPLRQGGIDNDVCGNSAYCMTHSVSLLGLLVPSPIPGAGLGLFATREFPSCSHLTSYLGEVLSKAELDARYGDDSYTAGKKAGMSSAARSSAQA